MKKIIQPLKTAMLAAMLAAMLLFAATAHAGTPTEALKTGLDKLISVLKDPQYEHPEQGVYDEQLEALRSSVHGFFDFRELTRRAVGRTWLQFTPEQQDRLTATFTTLLEKTYIRKLNKDFLQELNNFSVDSIDFTSEQIKGNLAMVNSTLHLTDKDLAVDFRLINKQETWWVYDVIGEGLTLLGIYRDEFRNALLNQTPDELIASLEERIKAVEKNRDESAQQ
ncbi:MAG: phospholipid-binding protein MlaC [Desulfovibrionaceae bacterium]